VADSSAAFITLASVQAGATIVLVIVTSVYVCLTRKMVREMKRAKEASLRPVLLMESVTDRPDPDASELIRLGNWAANGEIPEHVVCDLRNAGPGPALNVRFSLRGPDGHFDKELTCLAVGDVRPAVHLQVQRDRNANSEQEQAGVIRADYEDVYGNRFGSILGIQLDRQRQRMRFRLIMHESAGMGRLNPPAANTIR
jgi:hypothetical protein